MRANPQFGLVNCVRWKEVARVDAVAPFDCSFGASSPQPALELAGARLFVSDPVHRRIRAFDAKTLKIDRDPQ
jgi:hypothetical protein